ncbi:hypothetical protein EPO66_04820 [bacterium]|nr:MAG: hypothetical protein EPO66_04820 [bacterium]
MKKMLFVLFISMFVSSLCFAQEPTAQVNKSETTEIAVKSNCVIEGVAGAEAKVKAEKADKVPSFAAMTQEQLVELKEAKAKGCVLVCDLVAKCVPGCDPPDENNTVHGCSSCHHYDYYLINCHKQCDK